LYGYNPTCYSRFFDSPIGDAVQVTSCQPQLICSARSEQTMRDEFAGTIDVSNYVTRLGIS
jgi:hypothetical protein